jgi:hypothetical protein
MRAHNGNQMVISRFAILGMLLAVGAQSTFAFDAIIKRIEVQSQWGGLGKPESTELLIRHEDGTYRVGGKEIDSAAVQTLIKALHQPAIPKPSPNNLGLTQEWLETQASEIVLDAKNKEAEDSTYWEIGAATPEQQALFKNSYTNPAFVSKVLPSLFYCCHTDDYPSVKIVLVFADDSKEETSSHSQSVFMLPWNVIRDGRPAETFDRNISMALAQLLPESATNRERLKGDYLGLALAEVVMTSIEQEWKLIRAEGKCGDALAQIRKQYVLLGADVNPNHDVTFGVYSERRGGVEGNLHALVRKPSFPPSFSDNAILLYSGGKVHGVEEFLLEARRYEQLALSVPWLSRLQAEYPKWPITLLWVHDASLSNKGMSQFAADMHLLQKDSLAEEVRKMQRDIAVLNVSYGDWWLVLPDKRMVLWRYESVSGLLGLEASRLSVRECSEYQGVTGGCVGAIVSPDGELLR